MAASSIRAFGVALLLVAAAAPARAQGAVLVVDPVGGPFTTISDAIAAAADGDTIAR